MSNGQIVDIAQRAMFIVAEVGGPILVTCLVVGLIVSIFETATQIHEQSLSFVPKIVVVLLLLVVAGGWMVSKLSDFTREIFTAVAKM